MNYDDFTHCHRIKYRNGDWVFFFTTHLGSHGRFSEFTAARDGKQVYAKSDKSLKDLFGWVRAFEKDIGSALYAGAGQ